MKRIRRESLRRLPGFAFLGLGVAAIGLTGTSRSSQAVTLTSTPEQTQFFESRIRPVLVTSCVPCHSKSSHMSGLALDSRAGFLKGGDSGALVDAKDSDQSLLVRAVVQSGPLKMPQGGKLKPSEIADIQAWVKMGAPWPEDGSAKTEKTETLWSLLPVKKPAIPPVKLKGWVVNPIDSFVLSDLEAQHLRPAPATDRRTLIRRVTYDLTGLPPTPGEVEAFLTDKSPNAYGKVVDRLLASPHYGEKWARYWLDVARYADTKGYVFNEDRNYPNAYTYRDWVIDAINRDMPYDQFIEEQLAADLMPSVQNGTDKRPLAALGFLTVGRRFLNSVPDIIDDRIDVTMRGFEGFTVACARCHDHKFDPIPTQDYYSLYSVFNSSQEKDAPISDPSIRDPWTKHNDEVAAASSSLQSLIRVQVQKLRQEIQSDSSSAQVPSDVKAKLQAIRVEDLPAGDSLNAISQAFEPGAKDQYKQLQSQIADLSKNTPPTPEFAMAMEDRADAHDGVIFKRGNPGNPGGPAPRRFLAALTPAGSERATWTHGSGRLELAKSIASRQNPLTARVFVNRVWLHDFGAGIVRTPSDFGHQGEKPTNPALLDYLASSFMDGGWSLKKLNRLIVTSATYCQSSDVTTAQLNADPDNRLFGRMNRKRLDLEEMRDSLLFDAGQLDLKDVGGKSVDLWSKPFTDRRAVYGFVERQNLPGIFRVFDFATPDSTSPKRFTTTVPQQALFFMNSPFVVDAANEAASRPEIATAKDPGQQVRRLYLDLFDRLPDPSELAMGLSYLGPNPEAKVSQPSPWQYGYGGYDASAHRTSNFTPFVVFKSQSYRATDPFPDPKLGYVTLNSDGGHPGRDGDHATIRRWTAPADLTISIHGTVAHGQMQGDGVRARIVSSRSGLLGEWKAHNGKSPAELISIDVKKGETLDFAVDPMANDGYDSFSWSPRIVSKDGSEIWDARSDFSAPQEPLDRLGLYAQALMMTNEFMFID